MTPNTIILFFGLVSTLLFAIVTWRSFRKRQHATSELDRANARIKVLEGDVQTLYGRIGVLIGDNHPPGLRAPSNANRYAEKIAEMEEHQAAEARRIVDAIDNDRGDSNE